MANRLPPARLPACPPARLPAPANAEAPPGKGKPAPLSMCHLLSLLSLLVAALFLSCFAGAVVYPRCSNCDSMLARSTNRCAQCRVAKYCNRECQVEHWKRGGHKQECAQLAAARADSSAHR